MFDIDKEYGAKGGLKIAFATPETFADAAGSFLAKHAYSLNVSVLERLNSYLDA